MPGTIKLHLIGNQSEGDTQAQIEAWSKYFDLVGPEEADVLILATFFKIDEAMELRTRYKQPLVVYCWDYYLWNHGLERWPRYAAFLKRASLILVPSRAQQRRLKELLGLDSQVVHSGVPTFEAEVTDGNFILDPVRYYPEENRTWAEDAAKELNIPIIHSEHQFTSEEFKKLVASCTFLTCAYREASTGGLSLMEGLYLGKPSLVSNSPYMGAVDYLGDYGFYFQYDDFEDLKTKMSTLWVTRPRMDGREHLKKFTYDQMGKNLCEAIGKFLKG